MSGGDPYREDLSVLRERLEELQKKRSELRTQIRAASVALDRRYRAARVAERPPAYTQNRNLMFVPVWFFIVLAVGSIPVFGRLAVVVVPGTLVLAAVGIVIFLSTARRPPRDRLFDPTRYEEATAPAHLLAEHKWLDRDQDDADALAHEIDETRAFLDAQEKRSSRET